MKKLSFIIIGLFISSICFSQYVSHIQKPDTLTPIIDDPIDPRVKFANTITGEDIKAHLSILASDKYEGRETGQPGNDLAAAYIAKQFKSLGFPAIGAENSYYQPVVFSSTGWTNTEIYIKEERFKHLWDYLAYPATFENMERFSTDEVLFVGYGIEGEEYDDYRGKDVKDKVLMMYMGEPLIDGKTSRITGTNERSSWTTDLEKKLKLAKSKGAKMVLIVSTDLKAFLMENRKKMLGGSLQLGDITQQAKYLPAHAYISTTLAEAIIGSKKRKVTKRVKKMIQKGKSKPIALSTNFRGTFENYLTLLKGNNVVGFLEGSDLKDEIVVVSAHYDHLGIRGKDIYNGADDNGSGTSTVLDIAQAFKIAKDNGYGPRRSILFLLVTGEEKGLLGSQWFAENPLFPLEDIVVDVNVDMIGRIDDEHDHENYVYVIGSDRLSTDLHKINEKANNDFVKMELDYTYNSEDDPNRYYYRSDHYNFAVKGIPAIFYFSGVHADYHRTSDTVDKILFNKVERTGKLIFQTTWELANRDKRINVDGIKMP